MGLGKTTIALSIIEEARLPTLVIAPKTVCESVWQFEHKKWEHLQNLDVKFIQGNPRQRADVLKNKADVFVVSLDNFVWLVEVLEKVWPFKMLIVDESSRFKDPSTKRFKAMKKVVRLFDRRIILTGTPTPNTIADLWGQMALVDLGERLGKSLTAFRTEYLMPGKIDPRTRVVWQWKVKPGAEKIIQNKISDIAFSLRAEDYLTIPERINVHHSIQWTDRKPYDKLRRDMVVQIKGEEFTAVTAAALVNKLLQYTGGHLYHEDTFTQINKDKINFLSDIMEDRDEPTIIFYHYKSSLKLLKDTFPNAKQYEPHIIRDWNDGRIPILLLHPQSAGLGLNLQCNTHAVAHIVFYDLPWSSELYLQSIARVHRQGQSKPVIVSHLLMDNSIDAKVLEVLDGKISLQNAVMEGLSL